MIDKKELRGLCEEKAKELFCDELMREVRKRLDIELGIIEDKGYESIFIAASCIANKVKENGHLIGNRGYVAASLVAYILGITETDPLTFEYVISYTDFFGQNGEKKITIDLDIPRECLEIGLKRG